MRLGEGEGRLDSDWDSDWDLEEDEDSKVEGKTRWLPSPVLDVLSRYSKHWNDPRPFQKVTSCRSLFSLPQRWISSTTDLPAGWTSGFGAGQRLQEPPSDAVYMVSARKDLGVRIYLLYQGFGRTSRKCLGDWGSKCRKSTLINSNCEKKKGER
ncbi:hypothetical protein HPP92_028562 [Vanilla planifolia]|uniref:Uncharacterized protein n=1 Tax=Vanilla planifolia TaxID=51239 RepID=A0A835U407_VANPL|nr:hypothetical protein HPP92_028562 [Vanilla planifolia]KAG0446995.1 hypothetical protein HPP92_028567 [Vanilla planifolia]